jgi:two-component system, sensor histidine kinase PdtaS
MCKHGKVCTGGGSHSFSIRGSSSSGLDLTAAMSTPHDRPAKREGDLVARLHEMETLLIEVHHRVKSNLQVVASLLTLQAGASRDQSIREALTDAAARVQTVALIHGQLSETPTLAAVDLGTFIRRLVASVQQVFGDSTTTVSLVLNLDDFALPLNLVTPCALIVNELLTNAFRHAFIGAQAPHVEIRVHTRESIVTISVHDNGRGVGKPRSMDEPHGLGLRLMKKLAVQQLRGALTVTRSNGTEFTLSFPYDSGGGDV